MRVQTIEMTSSVRPEGMFLYGLFRRQPEGPEIFYVGRGTHRHRAFRSINRAKRPESEWQEQAYLVREVRDALDRGELTIMLLADGFTDEAALCRKEEALIKGLGVRSKGTGTLINKVEVSTPGRNPAAVKASATRAAKKAAKKADKDSPKAG